jgi:hypothetical protein
LLLLTVTVPLTPPYLESRRAAVPQQRQMC